MFLSYALFGEHFPGLLQHPGVKPRTFVSSMYFPQEGIFGVTLWVVSTIVFHFVLFGIIAPSFSADFVALLIASPAIILQVMTPRQASAGKGSATSSV